MNRKKLIIGGAVIGAMALAVMSTGKTVPKGAVAVKPFDIKKYLGRWYEIGRLDFRFEKNLNNTTADYSENRDGSIRVINRGYNYKTNKWKTATGKARFRGPADEARLKVSFFGPFYAGYNVIALDPDYRYALVAGKDLRYLWLLSREKTVPASVRTRYLKLAQEIGYDTSALVWVEHSL